MNDLTNWINSTTSFSNYTSPYSGTSVYLGTFNPNHTTNAAIASNSTAPTSGAACTSLFSSAYGYSLKRIPEIKKVPKHPKEYVTISQVIAIICTIRSVTVFIKVIQAIQAIQSNDACFMAPTGLALMILSMAAYIIEDMSKARFLPLYVDTIIVFTSFEVMFLSDFKDFRGHL